MGDFFLRESAIGSVLLARDKFLESDGAVYPSHVELFLAPVTSSRTLTRLRNVDVLRASWGRSGRREAASKVGKAKRIVLKMR